MRRPVNKRHDIVRADLWFHLGQKREALTWDFDMAVMRPRSTRQQTQGPATVRLGLPASAGSACERLCERMRVRVHKCADVNRVSPVSGNSRRAVARCACAWRNRGDQRRGWGGRCRRGGTQVGTRTSPRAPCQISAHASRAERSPDGEALGRGGQGSGVVGLRTDKDRSWPCQTGVRVCGSTRGVCARDCAGVCVCECECVRTPAAQPRQRAGAVTCVTAARRHERSIRAARERASAMAATPARMVDSARRLARRRWRVVRWHGADKVHGVTQGR